MPIHRLACLKSRANPQGRQLSTGVFEVVPWPERRHVFPDGDLVIGKVLGLSDALELAPELPHCPGRTRFSVEHLETRLPATLSAAVLAGERSRDGGYPQAWPCARDLGFIIYISC